MPAIPQNGASQAPAELSQRTLPRTLVLGVTPENKLRCASDSSPLFLGCQPADAIGRSLAELFVEPDISGEKLLASDTPLLLQLKRGEEPPLEVLASATRMHLEGSERVTLVTISDATQAARERHQLEVNRGLLQLTKPPQGGPAGYPLQASALLGPDHCRRL